MKVHFIDDAHNPFEAYCLFNGVNYEIHIGTGLKGILTPPEMRAVIAHESGHAYLHHPLKQLALRMALWFVPRFWSDPIKERARQRREQEADAWACQAINPRWLGYGQILLDSARRKIMDEQRRQELLAKEACYLEQQAQGARENA